MKTILVILFLISLSFILIDKIIKSDLNKSILYINNVILETLNNSKDTIIEKEEIQDKLMKKNEPIILDSLSIVKKNNNYICNYAVKNFYKMANISLEISD